MAAINPSPPGIDNPYVGPRTFEEKDGRFFFGREREARELLSMVISEPLVLFYAESGAGKSSLINTRLVPGLRQEGFEVLPIGRVSGELPAGITEVGNIFIYNLLLSLDQSQKKAEQLTHTSLADYLQTSLAETEVPDEDRAAVSAQVLIIDQFEEIVTAHLARWSEREQFFRQLRRAMKANPLLWVVLTLREDYVAALDPYARLLPGKLRARFHMQRMGYRAAQQAIEQPARAAGRPFAPGVANTLVDNLRQLRTTADQTGLQLGQFVEPVQLQVVCYQLWENLMHRPLAELSQLNLQEFGQVDMALVEFYEQAIRQASEQSGVSEKALRAWFDRTLTAEPQPDQAVDEQANDNDMAESLAPALQSLVDQYLLQVEVEAGQPRYTLVEQRFYPAILRANWTWWLRQEQSAALITQADVDELGDVDTALAQFYQQALARVLVQTDESEIELRRWFEKQLITEAGTRGTVYQGPEQTGGLANRTVQHLADQFILRAEIRAGGTWTELVHDRFIEPILQANQTWRARQSDLVQAALGWQEAGRPEDNLYRGQRLKTALARVSGQNEEPLVAEFLAASEKLDKELEEKEAFRQRELEQTQAQARTAVERAQEQARAAKRLRRLAIVLAVVFLLAISAAMVAWFQQRRAQTQEELAGERAAEAVAAQQTAEAEALVRATAQAQAEARRAEAEAAQTEALAARDVAARSALMARSGQLAAQAQAAMSENVPQRSLLLAVEALSITLQTDDIIVPAAQDTLWLALTNYGGLGLGEQEESIATIAISPDNRWLFTGSGATVQRWDLTNLEAEPVVLAVQESPITAIAISPAPSESDPDNPWLVVAGGRTVSIWDMTNLAGPPTILPSHNDLVTALAISPDNRRLVTGSADLTIRVWDLTRLDSEPTILPVQEAAIADTVISANNRWLVTTGFVDTMARVWDLTDLEADPITLSVRENPIEAIAISPDNQWLVAGSDDLYLWNLAASNPTTTPVVLPGESFVNAVTISSDSRRLAVGNQDGTIQVWDLSDLDTQGRMVLKGHDGAVTTLILSANPSSDGHTWLASGGADHTVRLWDLADLSEEPVAILYGHDEAVTRIAISSDNHWLVTGSADRTSRLWDLTTASFTAAPLFLANDEESPLTQVAISPDNHWLVTASEDGLISLWDLSTAVAVSSTSPTALAMIQSDQAGLITTLAISPDNRWLMTGSSDDVTAHLWDLQSIADPTSHPMVLGGHEESLTTAAFSPDSRWLATGSNDGTVRLWDLQNVPASTVKPMLLSGHEGSIRSIAISSRPSEDGPGKQWLATGGGDSTVRLWDWSDVTGSSRPGHSNAASVVLTGDEGWINAVAISPDNRWLAAGDDNGVVRLWNLSTVSDSTVEPIALAGSGASISAMAFSPDERWLVTIASADATARLWDLQRVSDSTPTPLILRGHDRSILAMMISADSQWLVTGSFDGTARLWNLRAADPAATAVVLRSHTRSIVAVAISPDNHWLVTGSSDTTARLWTLRPDELVELACRTAGRNLTAAEWAQYFAGQSYRQTCAALPPSLSLKVEDN